MPDELDTKAIGTSVEACDKVLLELEQGDVLVFRGDMVHAGAAYESRNVRMHVYVWWDSRKQIKNTNIVL